MNEADDITGVSPLDHFGFEIDWHLTHLRNVTLRLVPRAVHFSPAEISSLIAAVDAAMATWNRVGSAKVGRRSTPRIAVDRGAVSLDVDLGRGGLKALAEFLCAVDRNLAGAAVARCWVGHACAECSD